MQKIASRRSPHYTRLLAMLFPVLLVSCQTQSPVGIISAPVERAPASSGFIIDRQNSEIRLLVYRDGPLARFGHNHVIVGQVTGDIRAGDTAATSGFRLEIPVESLVIDSPAARNEEGAEFAAEVSDAARKGTRDNLLSVEVLDAARHPSILIASTALIGPRWNPGVTARVILRGVSRELNFPAAVFQQDDTLTIIATFRIKQSDFGMKPFAILGGAVQVRDTVDIRVRIIARPARD